MQILLWFLFIQFLIISMFKVCGYADDHGLYPDPGDELQIPDPGDGGARGAQAGNMEK